MALSKTSLVIQTEGVANLALGTLAAKTALTLGVAFNGITATFLAKMLRIILSITGLTAQDEGPFAVVIGNGDLTATEATNALAEGNTAGPGDTTQVLTQDTAFAIVQKSLRTFVPAGGPSPTSQYLDATIALGKGIPFKEGTGWQYFIYNLDGSALQTGAVVNGITQTWGVWLRD